MNNKEIEALVERTAQNAAQKAANKALNDMLLKMGINPQDPKSLLKMQHAFIFLLNWQESCETIRKTSLVTAVRTLVVGTLALVGAWLHFR